MHRSRLTFPLAMGLALACSGRDPAGGANLEISVDTVAGVERVRTSGVPPAWTLQERATIGGADEGPGSFGRISSITVDGAGRVFVADQQAREIRVFDARGRHLHSFGRRGQGPSEFESIYAIAWLDDVLIALDPSNARIGAMTAAGGWVGSIPHPRLTGPDIRLDQVEAADVYTLGIGPRSPDGRSMAHFYRYRLAQGGGESSGGIELSDGKRVVIDTLPFSTRPAPPTSVVRCDNPADRSMSFFRVPFAPGSVTIPVRDGLTASTWTADYRIAFIRGTRDTVRIVEREHQPVPVSDTEWEEGQGDFRLYRERTPAASCDVNVMSRPAVKPAISGTFHDDEGRLWVEAITAEGNVLDIFAPSGEQLGRTSSPERVRRVPVIVRDGKMYLVAADSLDVEAVKILDIRR